MTDTTAAPATTGTPAAPASPPAPPAAWHSTYDADTRGWLDAKGFTKQETADKALAEVVKTARNAESKLGVPADRILKLPSDMAAAGAMDEIYTRLGRPAKAEEYKFKSAVDGSDKEFVTWAGTTFHKHNLTQAQAEALYTDFETLIRDTQARTAEAAEVALTAEKQALAREWAGTAALNTERAMQAAARFGLTQEHVDSMSGALGYKATMKFLQQIGEKIGEDTYPAGSKEKSVPGLPQTPDGAKTRVNELKKDQEFVKKLHGGDADARRLWDALHKVMAA